MFSAATKMLTFDEVAAELHVVRSTVELWANGDADTERCLGSFKKGEKCRRVSLENLTKFVLLNTMNPRRPEWLTPEIESQFWLKLRDIVKQELAQQESIAA